MNEEEFKALVEKVGLELATKMKAISDDLQKKLNEEHANVMKGVATKEELEAMQNTVMDANKKLEAIVKTQGEALGKINKSGSENEGTLKAFEKEFQDAIDKGVFADIVANKSGSKVFTIKAAGITATIGLGGNAASVVENGSAAALLRLGDGPVYTIDRGRPFILDFVNLGNTNSAALIWFDEIPKEGDFEVVAEGGIKPLLQYLFERSTASYKKAAGRVIITEEFERDFPKLLSTIKSLMSIDVRNEMNDIILADMITNASAYAYNGLDNSVDNADDYAAIGAAVAQLQSLYKVPNVLVLNPADAWRMKLTKGTDGHYIMPPFSWNGQTYEFGTVIVDPRVAIGNFFIGDGNAYNVDLKGEIQVRIGYNQDDFIKNQYTMIVEQYFYNYISEAKKSGFIYANFAVVKADIEAL
jgi:hypothetical protein